MLEQRHGTSSPLLKDLAQAVLYLRAHAGALHIDVNQIAVLGFSAGAHLAASLGVHWNDPVITAACDVTESSLLRPNAMILGYPVITAYQFAHQGSIETVSADCSEPLDYWSLERCVTPQTPPTFLWYTMNDPCVPMESSLLRSRYSLNLGLSRSKLVSGRPAAIRTEHSGGKPRC